MSNLISLFCIVLLILDDICSVWSVEVTNCNDTQTELLDRPDYGYVNNSTVRRNLDGTELTTNGSDCEDDIYNPDIVVYAVKTTINCVTLLLAAGTISLHLYFRNLQTVFGILVTILCFFLVTGYVVMFVHNRYQYTHKVNDSNGVCAMLVYVRITLNLLYHSTVVTVYFHFTNLMYNTYKVRSVPSKFDVRLLFKYVTFIISLTSLCGLLILPYDLSVTRNAFATVNGYCEIEFEGHIIESFYIYIALLSLVIAAQMITFSLGMILYFLINKNFCEFKTTNIRVCLALISTSGLNTVLFLVSYPLSGSTNIPILLSSIATLTEQFVLLMIFSTSAKVKNAVTSNSV